MKKTVDDDDPSPEEHRLRHVRLHQVLLLALERLARDVPAASTALDLLRWAGGLDAEHVTGCLDELVADAMSVTGTVASRITLIELREWSRQQTEAPEAPYGERYKRELTRFFREEASNG